MKGNGDIKKYFDALNNRFDGLNKRLDAFEKRVDERLDALAAEVGDLKLKVESLHLLTTDMQRVQHILVKDVAEIKVRVDRLEDGQKRIIILITKLAERVTDFDSGKKFELTEVRHDEASQTLRGIIREQQTPYRTKKQKRK